MIGKISSNPQFKSLMLCKVTRQAAYVTTSGLKCTHFPLSPIPREKVHPAGSQPRWQPGCTGFLPKVWDCSSLPCIPSPCLCDPAPSSCPWRRWGWASKSPWSESLQRSGWPYFCPSWLQSTRAFKRESLLWIITSPFFLPHGNTAPGTHWSWPGQVAVWKCLNWWHCLFLTATTSSRWCQDTLKGKHGPRTGKLMPRLNISTSRPTTCKTCIHLVKR